MVNEDRHKELYEYREQVFQRAEFVERKLTRGEQKFKEVEIVREMLANDQIEGDLSQVSGMTFENPIMFVWDDFKGIEVGKEFEFVNGVHATMIYRDENKIVIDTRFDGSYKYAYHFHNFYEFTRVIFGEVFEMTNGAYCNVKKSGDVLFYNLGEVHAPYIMGDGVIRSTFFKQLPFKI